MQHIIFGFQINIHGIAARHHLLQEILTEESRSTVMQAPTYFLSENAQFDGTH